MSKFHGGKNPEQIRSAKWLSSSYAFKGHVARKSIGTSDAAEYLHAAADLPWGVLSDEGTQFNWIPIETAGVIKCVNSLAGTINIGDPVILDYTNSNGTTGFVKSAYTSEAVAAVGTTALGGAARIPLTNKAVPGSIRETGTNSYLVLGASGTVVFDVNSGASWGGGNIFYTIDQPVIGVALDKATSPRQMFRVQVAKERYIKNNTVN